MLIYVKYNAVKLVCCATVSGDLLIFDLNSEIDKNLMPNYRPHDNLVHAET